MLRATITFAFVLTTVPAYAQVPWAPVLRCVDSEGKVEYRASACPAEAREQVVVARTGTGETSTGETSATETTALAPIRRRAYLSPERREALDVAERYAAAARAARPQVAVQVLPLPPAK